MRHSASLTAIGISLLVGSLAAPVVACSGQTAQSARPATSASAQPKSSAKNQASPEPGSTKPAITSLSAVSGQVGSLLTIKGKNFDKSAAGDAVKFGDIAAIVTSATETTISTAVPANAKVGKTTVTVTTSTGTSNAASFSVTTEPPVKSVKAAAPVIKNLSAPSGAPGSDLIITGTGFGSKQGSSIVKFNDVEAVVVTDKWADSTITVVVPSALPGGSAPVTVKTSAGVSASAAFTVAPPLIWYGVVCGDFSPFINAANELVPIKVSILDKDYQVIGTSAGAPNLSPTDHDKLQIFYSQPDPKAVPAFVLVGISSPGDHQYPFAPIAKPAGTDPTIVSYQQVIAGDFCLPLAPVLPDIWGQCTTGLLTLNPATGVPVSPSIPRVGQIGAYVQAADGTSQKATLKSIGPDTADVTFTAAAGFKPAWLVLEGPNGANRFVYAPAPPVQISELIYTSDDMETICDLDPSNSTPDCTNTVASHLVLSPVATNAAASFVAVQKKLLVAYIRAPLGLEPIAILVTNTYRRTSIIVRRTIKPGANNNLLFVDMTIMDQVTAQRNYGNRIAKRYIAVTLDVKNPTAKKVQFNKSAMYFDVDYVEAKEQPLTASGFFQSIGEVSTLGLYQPSVYKPPFVMGWNETPEEKIENKEREKRGEQKLREVPRQARFGLEQNVKQSPENYLSILGSFDYTTQKTDDKLKALELVGSILSNIATGGLVADASGAFRAGTSVFAGTFLPGVRSIVLDNSFINRLRSNLVAQTLQETIQVPANGSATTVVLLPRAGILAFTDAEISVMINRVIDVHLIPEVVTEVTAAPPVQKGACKVGYSKDQTRDALGEPSGVTTNADGTSLFTYPKGPVTSASFDAGGSLVGCQSRSLTDQLAQATTLADMNEVLTSLNLTANKIMLTDSSVVLTDIPGVQQTYHFDSKGNKATDYTFLFPKIKAFETQAKSALDSFLEAQAKTLLPARSEQIVTEATQADKDKTTTATYDSPDIQNGKIVITFDNKAGTVPKTSKVKTISFTGDKPQSVN